jgi:hypothetical protein
LRVRRSPSSLVAAVVVVVVVAAGDDDDDVASDIAAVVNDVGSANADVNDDGAPDVDADADAANCTSTNSPKIVMGRASIAFRVTFTYSKFKIKKTFISYFFLCFF